MNGKKKFLLRIDAGVYDAIERWAADDLRSVNAQIEYILSREVKRAGRGKHAPAREAPSGQDGAADRHENAP